MQNSWIFNPGADTHVCNNKKNFTFFYLAVEDNYLIASGNYKQILAYRTVTITVNTPTGTRKITLSYIVLVSIFFTNLIALLRATANNIHFNLE